AVEYAVRLLQTTKVIPARDVVANAHNERLEVLLLHAEHKPGAALDLAIASLAKLGATAPVGNTATRIAADILALGTFLGRNVDAPIAGYIQRFLLVEPPALTHGVTTLFGTIAVCTQTLGAAGEKCLDRVAELYD